MSFIEMKAADGVLETKREIYRSEIKNQKNEFVHLQTTK